ncbi:hypothetical protein ARMGADRAFT_1103393 [Armillaria gallica]|uniref:Uncharacterized protein n=1 Tax=Armillaria gallica TaxID=47427 RepID=A0A2H3CBS5_ARMGA|nr:hypothetical protein ARMGADRAFT_1103393 [Armillaria gallica]
MWRRLLGGGWDVGREDEGNPIDNDTTRGKQKDQSWEWAMAVSIGREIFEILPAEANIEQMGRVSLLPIVDDAYEKANNEWEYWKSERWQLEQHLEEGWQKVNPSFLSAAANVFDGGGRQILLLISPVNAMTETGIY